MLSANKDHFVKVAKYGGGASVVFAAASLIKFSPLVAASVVMGAALGLFNLYAIVMLVEALAGAAEAGAVTGKGSKLLAMMVHLLKLLVIFGALAALVLLKLTNLFALLAGFTAVLIANLMVGLLGLRKDEG